MNYTNIYHLTSDKRLGKSGLGYLLDNLKSQGYEALRFMVEFYQRSPGNNQDNIPGGMLNLNPLEIAPEYMEAFWRLIAGCHERGMYLNVSLWHRNSVFGDICGDFNHKNPYVGFFHPEARCGKQEVRAATRFRPVPPLKRRTGRNRSASPTLGKIPSFHSQYFRKNCQYFRKNSQYFCFS